MTIQDVFEAVGAHAAGTMKDDELEELERSACPGAGACGGQFTANTMATAFELMGISPMGSAMVPAMDGQKDEVCFAAGRLVMDVLARGQTPSEVITRGSLENAIAGIATTGGSTNGVLHLLAVAREAGVELELEDFDRITRGRRCQDLKPGGRFVAADLYEAGGVGLVAKRLLDAGILNGDEVTATGAPSGRRPEMHTRTPGQEVVRPLDNPVKETEWLVTSRGNLAPDGCVVKVAGYERLEHKGPARVFECEEDAMTAATAPQIRENDVIVIRNEGPSGGPGMREMLAVTAALVGEGLGDSVALLTDGRFSGRRTD